MTDDLFVCESPVVTVPFGEATRPEPARHVPAGPLQLRGSGLPLWMDVRPPPSGYGCRADADRVAGG